MKKFYTFEPKNFRIFTKMKSFIAVALLLLMAVGTVNAAEVTITFGNGGFTTTSGTVNNYFSFTSESNASFLASSPSYNSSEQQLELPSYLLGGNGCSITLYAANGAIITGVELTAGSSLLPPDVCYYVDGGSRVDVSGSNSVYTMSGFEASSTVKIQNRSTITTLGVKSVKITYYVPCDAPVVKPVTLATTCEDTPYVFRGRNYTEAGTFYDTLFVADFCDTVFPLQLSVKPVVHDLDVVSSQDESITFQWTTITPAEFLVKLKSSREADAVEITSATPGVAFDQVDETTYQCKLALLPYLTPNTEYTFSVKTECQSEWSTYYAAGETYSFRVECPTRQSEKEDWIYPNTPYAFIPYTLGDSTFHAPGDYTVHFTDEFDCDSAVLLHLNQYVPDVTDSVVAFICPGGSYTFPLFDGNDTICTETYIYRFVSPGIAQYGLDSIRILNLTVIEEVDEDTSLTICENDLPYTFKGVEFGTSTPIGTQTYNLFLESQGGCDSAHIVLHLTVGRTYNQTEELTICSSELPYTWRDTIFPEGTESGVVMFNKKTDLGCDSIVTLNLTVNPSYNQTVDTTICADALPFTWRDTIFPVGTESGVIVFNRETAAGCDSTVTLNLTVNPVYSTTIDTTVCSSALPFHITGSNAQDTAFTEAGNYVIPFVTALGCDSTITLNLAVNPSYNDTIDVTICASELPYTWRDQEFAVGTTSGYYTFNKTTALGCDSIQTLNLTVNPVYNENVEKTICQSQLPYTFDAGNGNTKEYPVGTESLVDTIHFTTAANCDSTVILTLTVNPSYTGTAEATICANELPYTFDAGNGHEKVYPVGTESMIDTIIFNTELNCDSTVIMNLTVTPLNACEFTIHVEAGENGTILGDTVVAHGADATFTVKADDCYYVETITKDGAAYTFDPMSPEVIVTFDSVYANGHTLAVTFAKFAYTVTATAHGEGTITPTATFPCDTVVVYNYAAAAGYHIDSVRIDDEVITYTDENTTEGTKDFGSIRANHTMDVYYSINHYTVSISGGEYGIVDPVGDTVVTYGARPVLTFTVTEGCYALSSITVNGNTIDTTCTSYTLDSIKENTTVLVAFDTAYYHVNVVRPGNGRGTVNGNYNDVAGEYVCQSRVTFDVVADEGSHIDTIIWNGQTYAYTGHVMDEVLGVTHITQDMDLYVVFTLDKHQLTATTDGNGWITPNDTLIDYGTPATVTVIADTNNGYHIATITSGEQVWANSDNEGTVHEFTLNSVTTDTSVYATFELNKYTVAVVTEGEGTVVPDSAYVIHGNDLGFTLTASDCQFIDAIYVNGTAQTVTATDTMTFTISNVVRPDDTLRVVFSTIQYAMTSTYNHAEGTVSDSTVNCGTSYTYVITPNTGMHVDTIYVDGHENFVTAQNTYTFDNIRADHNIEVIFAINMYDVIATTDGNGTVTPDTVQVAHGGNQAFTFTPNDCYHFSNITVNSQNTDMTIDNLTATSFTLTNITEDVNVEVLFAIDTLNVQQTIVGNGTVNTLGDTIVTVLCGSDYIFNMEAEEGYHIVSYTISGGTSVVVDNTESYVSTLTDTIKDIHADSTLTVNFAVNTYTIYTETLAGQGSFDPTSVTVNYGDATAIIVTADSDHGYHIASVTTADTNYTYTNDDHVLVDTIYFNNVTANDTLKVEFALDLHLITVINNGHGDIHPTDTSIMYGDDVTFAITPDDCYFISSVKVDEAEETITDITGMDYTFTNVVDTHKIEVTFAPYRYIMSSRAFETTMGTVTSDTVDCGESYTYRINANEGYHIMDVYLDNVLDTVFQNQEAVYEVTVNDIRENHKLVANFAIDYYHLYLNVEGEGTLVSDPTDISNVIYNTPIQFTMAPADDCHELTGFTINDTNYLDQVVNGVLNWNAIDSGEVLATFSIIRYEMAANFDATMGTVSTDTVDCGSNYKYVIDAAEGYHIVSYTIGDSTANYGSNSDVNDTLVIVNVASDTTLDVTFAINTYNVSVCSGIEHGTVTPGVTTINHGDTCTVTIVADTLLGYHIATITCGDDVVTLGNNDNKIYTYSINGIVTDTAICATFELNRYTVTSSVADEYCTINPLGDSIVRFGDTVSYIIKPVDDCHFISTIVVDATDTTTINDSTAYTYNFNDIRANHTIVVNSAVYTYIAMTSVNYDSLGTITPTDTLDCGENFAFEVTPITGYHIDSVTIGGVAQTIADSSTYSNTIEDIHADVAIVAYFGINHYTIASTSGDNGTIAPEDTIVYEYGQTPAYVITPNACYYISEVLVDDQPVEITDSTGMTYTFDAIDANHTIHANFAIYTYAMTAEYDDWMGTVTTADAQECGSEYKYIIDANEGYHIVSYTIGGVTTNNTMVEPNDFVTDTVVINSVSQDTNLLVVFDTNTYTVSACTGITGGTLVVNDPTEVNHNEGTTVTVTADWANGYHIVAITDGRGNDIELGNNTDTTYTYNVNNVIADVEVCATFALNTFVITATAGENGTITPEGDTTVTYGDMIDFVIEPNHTCYYISNILVDDSTVWVNYTDSVNAYTYTINVSEFDQAVVNHTIATEYTIFEYTMASNAYADSLGTVSSATVECGTDYTYQFEAIYGYHIDHVVLDGVTTTYEGQQTADSITVTDIHENHQLDVYFEINHYTVTATAGEHGSIEVAGVTTVAHGDELTYTITPDNCYYISELLVNDEAAEFTTGDSTGATYTFASVEDTMTIHANFHIYEYVMSAEYDETMGTVEEGIANCGSNFTYHVTANEGYHIVSITVGSMVHSHYGLNEDTEATFNVYNVSQDTVCYVVFEANTYTVNFNVTGEGEVEPGNTTVTYDSTLAYTVTAAEGYHVVSVTDNGTEVYSNTDRDVNTYEGTIANIRENHTVDVVFAINQYTITATAGAEGQIVMPGENTVNYGENINFTIRATEACYHIDRILVDGEVDTTFSNNETLYVYTFNAVDADHTIEAQFATSTYTVVVTSNEGGSVDPSEDTTTFNCGDNATYTFTPDEGYEIVSVTVNGTNMGAQDYYTITNIQNDYTIDVVFGQLEVTLTSIAYNHGTIDPLGDTTVAAGSTVVYTLSPEDCYTVSELLVNGVSYMNNEAFDGTTLTLADLHNDMMIQAYFQIMKYTVTTEAAEGGAITETNVYNCGTDVVITITPEACYDIESVVVDGEDQGAITEISFNALDTNHTVSATFTMKTYVITATVNDDQAGTITETDTFNCGEAPTYEITANEGYHIVSVEVDGEDQGAIESYTFGSLNENHTITANFAINTYTLTVNANAGVEIAPVAGDTTVEYGASVTYTFTADSCHEIADVILDGESIGAVDSYTFTDVDADHVMMVTTTVKTYTITATANEGGTITPAGETTVTCNGTQSYSITAAAGYYVEDVLVDGSSVGVVNNYVFSGVTEDHTIEVVFASTDSLTYTITATAGANGTITPEGDTTVLHGASVTYVITPDEYYTIDQVIVDGNVLLTPVHTYTFSNVTADHTIEVTFVADQVGCITPSITYTTNITETSATFNWNDTEATSYTVRYKKTGDSTYTIVTGITGTTYDVTGLEEASEYVWNVKAVCVDSVAESAWSVAVLFTTEETLDTTGISTTTMSAINVYSYGNDIYVTNESNEQIKDVQVYDINGRMIHRGMVQSNPEVINVTASNGIYIVRVVTDKMVRNFKVSITQR